MTKTISKGEKNPLTRVNIVNEENEVVNTYIDRKTIEMKVSNFNRDHYCKLKTSPVFWNYDNKHLIDEEIRNKILNGTFKREELTDLNFWKFLKLLKTEEWTPMPFKPVKISKWS